MISSYMCLKNMHTLEKQIKKMYLLIALLGFGLLCLSISLLNSNISKMKMEKKISNLEAICQIKK